MNHSLTRCENLSKLNMYWGLSKTHLFHKNKPKCPIAYWKTSKKIKSLNLEAKIMHSISKYRSKTFVNSRPWALSMSPPFLFFMSAYHKVLCTFLTKEMMWLNTYHQETKCHEIYNQGIWTECPQPVLLLLICFLL